MFSPPSFPPRFVTTSAAFSRGTTFRLQEDEPHSPDSHAFPDSAMLELKLNTSVPPSTRHSRGLLLSLGSLKILHASCLCPLK